MLNIYSLQPAVCP